jgi:hypothetical protein
VEVLGFIVMFLRLGEMLIDAGELCDGVSPNVARPELVDREGSFRAVGGRRDAARLKCFRAWLRVRESEPLSLRVGIRNRSLALEQVGLQLKGV